MAMIPAITTGIIDFIINSGRITDMAAMPTPDFAVPYAAPKAEIIFSKRISFRIKFGSDEIHSRIEIEHLQAKTMADADPIAPKKTL